MESTRSINQYKLLSGFILLWLTVNIFQAWVTGIYPDEAYYWIFSRHLQWGYFDHPPFVALSIKAGELIGHNSLFTRLGSILLSVGSIFFLYKALPASFADARLFLIGFVSVIIFHIYAFVATPDGPLFFFTSLFFYAYRRYLQADNWKNCVLLTVGIVGMLYSKYHGVLPLLFVFLSNPKLIFKTSAWSVIVCVAIALLPHVYWQYSHDWPSLRYHLSDRVASAYRISKTTNYIIGQLLVWGPVTTIPAFFCIFKMRNKDPYLKAHVYTLFGSLIFFFLFSFKGKIEPHWTLVAGVSFIVLLVVALEKSSQQFRKMFTALAVVNLLLIVAVRVLLFIPGSPITKSSNLKALFYGREWADSVYKYAGTTPVVFIDSYVLPSLYLYYHPEVHTSGFNTINYRKTHFTISDYEIKLNNQKAFVETHGKIDSSDLVIKTRYTNVCLHLVDSFKAVNALKIEWNNKLKVAKAGEEIQASVTVTNCSQQAVVVDSKPNINYTFFKTRKERVTSPDQQLAQNQFQPGQQIKSNILLKMPEKPGNYRLIFSLKYFPFEASLASNYFNVAVR